MIDASAETQVDQFRMITADELEESLGATTQEKVNEVVEALDLRQKKVARPTGFFCLLQSPLPSPESEPASSSNSERLKWRSLIAGLRITNFFGSDVEKVLLTYEGLCSKILKLTETSKTRSTTPGAHFGLWGKRGNCWNLPYVTKDLRTMLERAPGETKVFYRTVAGVFGRARKVFEIIDPRYAMYLER